MADAAADRPGASSETRRLAAAIPAVLAYNAFATALGRLQQAFSSGIARLGDRLARDGASPARQGAAA